MNQMTQNVFGFLDKRYFNKNKKCWDQNSLNVGKYIKVFYINCQYVYLVCKWQMDQKEQKMFRSKFL